MAERIGFHEQFGEATLFFAKPSIVVAKTYQRYLEQRAWDKTKELTWLSADEMKQALNETRRDIVDGKYAIGGAAYNDTSEVDNTAYFLWLLMKDANPTLTKEGFDNLFTAHGDKMNTCLKKLFPDKTEQAKN